jgi:histidinol-phosphatase
MFQGEWAEYANFASKLATEAATVSQSYFRKPVEVMHKADNSPVTIADQETERHMREMIENAYPDHGILGEEHGRERMNGGPVWVIDPIDGTKSFILGVPLYGTLIALTKDSQARIGVISMPALNEVWIGVAGEGCFFNQKKCQVSKCRNLEESVVLTTSPDFFVLEDLEKFEKISRKAHLRRYGGDCYIYGLVASGYADLAIEAGLQPYDFMALIPVIEEAGGVISDWKGNPLTMESDGKVVAAATAELHREALEILS